MKIRQSTISALRKVVCGDQISEDGAKVSPYLSGSKICEFLNNFGGDLEYEWGSAPSRWMMAESGIKTINGTDDLKDLIEAVVDPDRFEALVEKAQSAVDYLNRFLKRDGYELIFNGTQFKVQSNDIHSVEFSKEEIVSDLEMNEFIKEQVSKCQKKIMDKDYDGAITNARSLVEAVLEYIAKNIDPKFSKYDGKLAKLYGNVRKGLNLDPTNLADENMKAILKGLAAVVAGFADASKLADRHPRRGKPEKHHAVLVVNAAMSFSTFILSSYEYQKSKGKI